MESSARTSVNRERRVGFNDHHASSRPLVQRGSTFARAGLKERSTSGVGRTHRSGSSANHRLVSGSSSLHMEVSVPPATIMEEAHHFDTGGVGGVTVSAHNMALQDIRSSEEYRVAWDLECWRLHETKRVEETLQERERTHMQALQEKLRRLELDANRQRERKRNELREKEEQLNVQEQTLLRRFEQLDEQERNTVHKAVELEAKEKRIRDDTDAQLRRLKEDMACQAELHARKHADAQQTIHALRNQVARLEVERAALWDALNEAKLTKAAPSASGMDHSAVHAYYEAIAARTSAEQWKVMSELREEIRSLQAQLTLAAVPHARSTTSVHCVPSVRTASCTSSSSRSSSESNGRTKRGTSKTHRKPPKGPLASAHPQRGVIPGRCSDENGTPSLAQLRAQRSELLATGAYTEESNVIRLLDERIRSLAG